MRQPIIRPTRVFDRDAEKNRPIASLERQTQAAVGHLAAQKLDPSSVVPVLRSGLYRAKVGDIVRCEPPVAGVTVLLPSPSTALNGRTVTVKKILTGANPVTVKVADGVSKIDGSTTWLSAVSMLLAVFTCDGRAWWQTG